jgi:hypothetical protein
MLFFFIGHSTQDHTSTLSPRQELCPGIEGNPDFYGLGIRIGVYLQWLSSWLSNTINPSGAATNHDANTTFLLAILIATEVARENGELKPAETYIMLLLSSGFVFTVLSFLGLRLHFLRPSTLRKFRSKVVAAWKDFCDNLKAGVHNRRDQIRFTRIIGLLIHSTSTVLTLGFKSGSGFKHPALSWAGVAIRCATGTILGFLSVYAWWQYPHQALPDSDDFCTPTFFFFGPRKGAGNMLVFFKTIAIILLVPVGFSSYLCVMFSVRILALGEDWVGRYVVIKTAEAFSPGSWDALSSEKREFWRAMLRLENVQAMPPLDPVIWWKAWSAFRPSSGNDQDSLLSPTSRNADQTADSIQTDNLNSWNIAKDKLPPFRIFGQGMMSFLARGIEARSETEPQKMDPEYGHVSWWT